MQDSFHQQYCIDTIHTNPYHPYRFKIIHLYLPYVCHLYLGACICMNDQCFTCSFYDIKPFWEVMSLSVSSTLYTKFLLAVNRSHTPWYDSPPAEHHWESQRHPRGRSKSSPRIECSPGRPAVPRNGGLPVEIFMQLKMSNCSVSIWT